VNTNRMMLISEDMNGFADPQILYAPENIYAEDKNFDDNDESSRTENTAHEVNMRPPVPPKPKRQPRKPMVNMTNAKFMKPTVTSEIR
jgi:hypothetical protein